MERHRAGKNKKEIEQSQNQIILFIDDDLYVLRHFEEPIAQIKGLEPKFSTAQNLAKIKHDDLEKISLVFADQFYTHYNFAQDTKKFIDKLVVVNPKVKVIEMSYFLTYPRYKNTVSEIDTTELTNEIREDMVNWPKTADGFIQKFLWSCDEAFGNADRVERIETDPQKMVEQDFLKVFNTLLRQYDKLTQNKGFNKLLDLVHMEEYEFAGEFMSDNNLNRRKAFLHNAWQTVGHLNFNNGEEFYAMSLQRLKESFANNQ